MSREEIQTFIYDWAQEQFFTAPYGILTSKQTNKIGRSYRSVTFGYARTRDFEVQIYGPKFMVLRDSRKGNTTFGSPAELMDHLATLI
jgi:hypothetical protein